ncbi:DUF3846 domain-containing protein (plasmid) [Providencia huaxiensis]|uniref:DUF3846 domain-containing protein n=5 Tax=Enterobacterales TaxID=91347 RepID=A0AA42FGA7_9GAMM|nr:MULTISPECIES: DUF3846 domain-containing protein [Enterobacterales]ELB1214887.1 DUF3846 domain-containing protein [Proteus mirabilis]ELY4881529.1 DUF3846 domain-containing protein [Morganella morganii]SPY66517.1 Domain of uncharacterised function (DUF3846) [Providencia stuartii]ELR5094328.1 DUF3846 domain-containing protein [Providencia rettgeri]ELR5243177.1 DUF3846 domain-containing protein [Providencia rettgeri]
MALLVKADGTTKIIRGEGNGELSLETMNDLVGGYLQHVGLSPALILDGKEYVHFLCDEDGKRKEYAPNQMACSLLIGKWLDASDCVVGDILLLESGEIS